MNFFTSGEVIAFLSFWKASFLSSPSRIATTLPKGGLFSSSAMAFFAGLKPASSA